jgi:hypothetical protein
MLAGRQIILHICIHGLYDLLLGPRLYRRLWQNLLPSPTLSASPA